VKDGPQPNRQDPEDRSVRRTWWLLSGSFLVLAAITVVRAATAGDPITWLAAAAVGVAAIAAIAHRNAVVDLEVRGRAEAENFARILSGLSRSVSIDAIVGAIVEDLADATGADHVVVVRRPPEGGALEATLVTRRAGVPNSTTVLPLGDLDLDGVHPPSVPVAIPIRPETEPLPDLAAASREDRLVAMGSAVATAAPIGAPAVPGRATAATRPAASGHPAVPSGRQPATLRSRARPATADALTRLGAWTRDLLEDFGLAGVAGRDRSPRLAFRSEVLGTGVPSLVAARIAERVRAVYGLSHTLTAPLRTPEGVIGAIVVSRRDREAWDVPARRLLEGAAVEAAAALARAYSYREATANASTDPLTGLPNRRYFDEFCGLLARRRRSGDAVAVLMVDIDRFKVLNDTYGHPIGDEVLKAVAEAIVSAVREEDVPARVGGEEFAVLLRNPGPDVAVEVGERVREAVRTLDLRPMGVPGVSVSVGVANARGADEPIPSIVDRADQALYRAKRAGRDRVIAA
jgi:diguanylate cyclase (GGDEF)-like protein